MYDPFVIPFSAGLAFLVLYIIIRFGMWIFTLPRKDILKFFRGLFSYRLFTALWEMFREGLLHRRMYLVNPLLGFMHMSFAFGWFMLIVMGNLETRIISGSDFNPPYYPIFFKYFEQQPLGWKYAEVFSFIMDLLLLYVLSGLLLALVKRWRSRILGLKRTTRQRPFDRIALTTLWLIFPFRLLAESFTSGLYGNGSFMTGPLGDFFASFLPLEQLMMPAWWAYSLALGLFFVAVPFSRYMHIPTELLLILYRRFGIQPGKHPDGFTQVEVNACPRCGVCIDKCQLSMAADIHHTQPVYFFSQIRSKTVEEDIALNCLMCGRCKEYCPVGIYTDQVRLTERSRVSDTEARDFGYVSIPAAEKAEIAYFAGCMTHLQPSIHRSLSAVFDAAGLSWTFLDRDGSICCGRPLMLAGEIRSSMELAEKNRKLIEESGARLLVTSCPICYKVFREDYGLSIPVMHHSQFLLQLAREKKIRPGQQNTEIVYHDPCDLGRGSGVYDEPRQLLSLTSKLTRVVWEKEQSLCCGAALGNFKTDYVTREKITRHALEMLTAGNPDALITACPLCKKTFAKSSAVPVYDIAEWIQLSMVNNHK